MMATKDMTQPLKLPPHSEAAEQGVLSCLLREPMDLIPTARAKITGEAFYTLTHRAIWDAILALSDRMVAVDLITLQEHLKTRGELENVGGLVYLSSLYDAAPSAANYTYYESILLEKQMLRGLLKVASKTTDAVYTSDAKAEAVVAECLSAVEALTKADVSGTTTAKVSVGRVIDRLQAVLAGTLPPSIKTGLSTFDDKAGGLWGGDLIVIAARPSVGKTSLMVQIAQAAASAKDPAGLFSAEMSADSLTERAVGGAAGVNTRWVSHWREPEFKAFMLEGVKFAKLPIFIDDTPKISVEKIRAITREWVKKHGVKMIGVDYVQLLTTEKKTDNREQEVAYISNMLKLIARENNIAVLALAQLNRESEKKGAGRPKMSQMRESGALEQDADVAGLLYRADEEEEGGEQSRYSGQPFKVFLDVQKNRYGGVFRVPMMFHPKNQRMAEISKIDQ